MFGLDLNSSPDLPPVLIGINPLPLGKFEVIVSPKNISSPVSIALPENEIFSKILLLERYLSDNEILHRLTAYFADFNQPLAWDFQRLEENKILAIAAPLAKIKELCDRVPKSIKINAIESEGYAIARALKKTQRIIGENFGFSYCENNKIKLAVFEKNYLIYYDEAKNNYLENLEDKINLFKKSYPHLADISIISLENKPYLLALGLALREKTDWNLYPGRAEDAKLAHRNGILFISKAALFSLIACFIIHILLNLFFNQSHKTLLPPPTVNTTQSPAQTAQINQLKHKLLLLDKLKLQQQPSIQLLNNLNHVMPEGVFLTQLKFNNPEIELSGRAVTQEQVDTLMKNLKNINFFNNPVLNNTQPDMSEPPYNFSFAISTAAKEVVPKEAATKEIGSKKS